MSELQNITDYFIKRYTTAYVLFLYYIYFASHNLNYTLHDKLL